MAMILDAFVGNCINTLSALVEEEVIMLLGVDDELKKLQRRLRRICSVLKDAERRMIQDEAINDWLNELKGVMYEADDILDLCRFEGGRLLEDQHSNSKSPVRCYSNLLSCFTSVPLRHEIGQRIKNLSDRLEEISKDKLMLTLEQAKPDDDVRLVGVNIRQTSQLVEHDIVGRGIADATNRLAELIVGKQKQKCRVFAIVGMGGIGKTTLAQNLFNEPWMQNSFQLRVWVCVSQGFSETNLLKQMIRSAGGVHHDAQTKAELLPILMSVIQGKRLFLVLDDVWRADVWVDLLRNPLQSGPDSCSILVTTRKESVAMMMGAVTVHRVEELPVDSGWELLRNRVFTSSGEEEEQEIQSFIDIGKQIINKCHGLPLAIKTMAGVLSMKQRTRGEWEKVLRSNAWAISQLPEELRGALYLSYQDLPSHLKQCFLYLSLFPENYHHKMFDLVGLWIAEGLVETQGSLLEDTAEEYYNDLVRRSLLLPVPESFRQDICTMHDILRHLTCFLSQNECFYGDAEELSTSATSELRRLSISNAGERRVLTDPIALQKSLRTLLFLNSPSSIVIEHDLISKLAHLRVLRLNGEGIDHIPDSIGDLIHLRYLNLDASGVRELPEPLGRLANLQFLDIRNCMSLHTLPKGITRLHSLRRLSIENTPLNYLPKGIGKLKQLNHLQGVLGDDLTAGKPQKGCDLEDLQCLPQLRYLTMGRLEMVSAPISALKDKSYLKLLHLYCSTGADRGARLRHTVTEEEMGKIEVILDELVPPPCLQSFLLGRFFGRTYPKWMSPSLLRTSVPHLNRITFEDLLSCTQVPPLGELSQLKYIKILNADAIVTIGPEFIGLGALTAFPKLEVLRFERVTNWEEWSLSSEAPGESRSLVLFPRLQDLLLKDCPCLRALPRGLEQAMALQRLFIHGAHSITSIEDLPSLSKLLSLRSNHSLGRISGLPAVKTLEIKDCPALKSVENLNALQKLSLSLTDNMMECLPKWLLELLQQQLTFTENYFRLDLCCHIRVLRRCIMGGPDWPIIQLIPYVDVRTEDGSAYLYYTKEPFSYTTNIAKAS